jgi:hypothetical protein
VSYPKYILRKNSGFSLSLLEFQRVLPTMHVAEYGRVSDTSLRSWRSLYDIVSKRVECDVLYFGKVTDK